MRNLRERIRARRGHQARRVKPLELALPDFSAPDPLEAKATAKRAARMKRFDAALKWVMSRKPNAAGFTCVLPEEATGFMESVNDEASLEDKKPEIGPRPKPGPHNQ